MEKINRNIKEKIMSIIKMRHIEPKSRNSLYLQAFFSISFLILISILAIIVLSFIGFVSRIPVELIMLFVILSIGLYFILSNKEVLSDIPRVYTLMIMLGVLILISLFINVMNVHRHIMRHTKHLSSMRMMYERYEPKALHDTDMEDEIEVIMK